MLSGALFHLNKRKRATKHLRPYPSPNKYIRVLDKIILFVAIVGPASAIPQIARIFYRRSAGDVSTISWVIFLVFDIPWIIYGIVHKEKPIVIAYILWFIANLLVVIGSIIY